MMKTLTIGLSALALSVAGAAVAQQGGMKANSDREVTRAEAQTKAGEMFDRMDANHDGALTDADREARRQQMRTRMFAALDADGNGQISQAEFMSFKHEGKRGEMGKRGHKRGHWGGRHRGDMKGMADANKDGSISKAEFTNAALTRFDTADANKDGKVTSDERKAARDAMRTKWREMKAEKAN